MSRRFPSVLFAIALGGLVITGDIPSVAYAAASVRPKPAPSKASAVGKATHKKPAPRPASLKKSTPTKVSAARSTKKSRRRPARPVVVNLVWHVETLDGEVLESSRADESINPASVIKAATSLWALDKLGPEHRFETRFLAIHTPDTAGSISSDLYVQGALDPDFQPENAFLVAAELNRLGVARVTGALVVSRDFWIGYEGGSEGREVNPTKRALIMAARLRQAWNPAMWTGGLKRAWRDTALRHGLDPDRPPRVSVLGGIQEGSSPMPGVVLATHRSRRLLDVLHAFNAYSNNDMERVAESIGTPVELAAWLSQRWGVPSGAITLETTSGLGINRLTPRQLVTLMRDLKTKCDALNLRLDDVLASAGCVPGTVSRFYQTVAETAPGSLVGKTGTLTATDGGVSVFAGIANTARGPLVFSVAVPEAHGKLRTARSRQQQWIIDMAARNGGFVPRLCTSMLTPPDSGAEVQGPTPLSTSSTGTFNSGTSHLFP